MTLQSFGISNFKAFGQSLQRMPLKPITLIFGPNSAGKSSLIQGLLWTLHCAKVGSFESRVSESALGGIDLGDFRTLLHRKEVERGMETRRIEIEFSFADPVNGSPVRVIHQLGITSLWGIARFRKALNAQLEIAFKHDQLWKAHHDWGRMIKVLFRHHDLDDPKTLKIIQDDKVCQEHIETMLRENIDMGEDELYGCERLGGRRPVPEDVVEAYKEAGEARKQLRAFEEEHIKELETHWDRSELILDQERDRCSVLAVEIYHGENLVLRAGRPPGDTELKVEVLDSAFAEHLALAPDLWTQSFVFSATGQASAECLFSPYKVKLDRKNFHEGFSDQTIVNVLAWLSHLRRCAADLDQQVVYLGPLRHLPERRSLIGVPGEAPANPGLKTWTHLRDQPSLQKQVNLLLARLECRKDRFQNKLFSTAKDFHQAWEYNRKFDALYSEDEEAAYSHLDERLKESPLAEVWTDLVIYDIKNQVAVEMRDVGVGISQMVPILIHAGAGKNQLIAIEQPELHLHPALQAELADIFIESSLGENKNKFLLETHSEHLILRILRRIRETTEGEISEWPEALRTACPTGIRPEDVAVIYVQPGEDGAEVIELSIDANGEFTCEWPGGFFEERLKEFF